MTDIERARNILRQVGVAEEKIDKTIAEIGYALISQDVFNPNILYRICKDGVEYGIIGGDPAQRNILAQYHELLVSCGLLSEDIQTIDVEEK